MTSSDTIEKVRDAIIAAGFNTWDQARAAISAMEQSGGWQGIETPWPDCLVDVWTVGWRGNGVRVADCYYDKICGEWRTSRPAGQLLSIPERYVTHWRLPPTPPGAEAPAKPEPTQFGDDVAAEMRAYFEAHKRDKWQEGTADNLMLGLFNIASRARAEATPLLEQIEKQ